MGGGIARVDCVCMLLVAQTRVRRVVAGGSDFVLRCFICWVDDCCGGCYRKEVSMWFVKFLCGFIVVMCTISLLVGIIVFSIMYKRKKKEMREWQKYKGEHVVQFGKSNSTNNKNNK